MATLPATSARAELAEAAQKAEVEALALLNATATAQEALAALAICTARIVNADQGRKPLEVGPVALCIPWSAWVRLLEFLAINPAYEPSEAFPYTKWQLSAAWLMPEEESVLALDVAIGRNDGIYSVQLQSSDVQHNTEEPHAQESEAGEWTRAG